MSKMPFKMKPSTRATLLVDGKFKVGGRASFVWETLLQRRASGVPGECVIIGPRSGRYVISLTIEEAEEELMQWGVFGYRRVAHARKFRDSRRKRGLVVE